jgi:hypothetical protein
MMAAAQARARDHSWDRFCSAAYYMKLCARSTGGVLDLVTGDLNEGLDKRWRTSSCWDYPIMAAPPECLLTSEIRACIA